MLFRSTEALPPAEVVFEKMSDKLVRGVTNVATCPVELPKQIYKTTRDRGAVGAVIGLFKGVGMVCYRAVCGALETASFLVPAPGFYDPLAKPPFVWQDWGRLPPPESPDAPAFR